MKILPNKISALLFILVGAAPLLFIIITGVRQQQIRLNMKQQLESNMLHTITLSKNNVYWVKAGKEILVNGRMFDVKSSQPAGDDKISFTGLFDEEETALLKKVKETQQKNNNSNGKLLAHLFHLFQAINNSSAEVVIPSTIIFEYPGIEEGLASPYITILSPPPQV